MIIRSKRRHDFTIIPNSLARDHNLSMKDKGLLVDMLSYPDNWHFHLTTLVKQYKNTTSESSIRRTLKDLKRHGYIAKGTMHRRKGKYKGRDLVVYDHPVHPEIVHNEQKSPQNRGKSVHNEQNRHSAAVQVRTVDTAVHNEHSPLFKYEQRSNASSADNHGSSAPISHRCSSTNTYKDCNTVYKRDSRKINKKTFNKNGNSASDSLKPHKIHKQIQDPFMSTSNDSSSLKDPFSPQSNSSTTSADKAAGFTAYSNSSVNEANTRKSKHSGKVHKLFMRYKNYFQSSNEDQDFKVVKLIEDCLSLPKYKSITSKDLQHEIDSLIHFDEYGHHIKYTAYFMEQGIERILRRKHAQQKREKHAEIERHKRNKAHDKYIDLPIQDEIKIIQKQQNKNWHPSKDGKKFLESQRKYHELRRKEMNKKL